MKNVLTLLLVSLFSISVFAADKNDSAISAGANTSSSKSSSTFNITVAPVTLLIGMISGSLEYKLSDTWTLGPDFTFWNITLGSWKWGINGLGAKATWYANGAYNDSWYVYPSIDAYSFTASYSSGTSSASSSASASMFLVGGGYAWFWNSFNMNLGLTAGTVLSTNNITLYDSNGNRQTTSFPTIAGLDFRLGFTF